MNRASASLWRRIGATDGAGGVAVLESLAGSGFTDAVVRGVPQPRTAKEQRRRGRDSNCIMV